MHQTLHGITPAELQRRDKHYRRLQLELQDDCAMWCLCQCVEDWHPGGSLEQAILDALKEAAGAGALDGIKVAGINPRSELGRMCVQRLGLTFNPVTKRLRRR